MRPARRLNGFGVAAAAVVAAAIAGVIAGCSSADQNPLTPSMAQRDLGAQTSAQSATNGCPTATTVVKEIGSLYPGGAPMYLAGKAAILYAAELFAVGPIRGVKPDSSAGRQIAITLVDTTLKLFRASKLTGGMSSGTASLAVAVLDAFLCSAGLPQSLTVASLTPGSTGAAQVVAPNAPTTIVATGDLNAAVQIPAGNLKQLTLVTITPLINTPPCAPYSGPLCTPLAQFPPYYLYTFTPSVDSTVVPNPFTFEVCATTTNINVPLTQIFLAHNVTTAGVTAAQVLPKPTITLGLECDGSSMGPIAPSASPVQLARAGDLRGAASSLASSVEALFVTDAFAGGTRITSVGGTAHSASPFGLVDVADIIPYQNGMWAYHAPTITVNPPLPMTGDITGVSPAFGTTAYVPATANGWVLNSSPFGTSPFGSGTATDHNASNCPLSSLSNLNLVWPSFVPGSSAVPLADDPSTIFLMQQTFFVPVDWPANANVVIGVAIDNDIQIFLNGQDITNMGTITPGVTEYYDGTQFLIHEGCATEDSYVITLPVSSFHTGTMPNVIAIRARDRGDESYLDVRVSSSVPFIPPVPAP